MSIRSVIGRKLGWKLFLSHLLVVAVGTVAFVVVTRFRGPAVLSFHLDHMGNLPGMMSGGMDDELRVRFFAAVYEILLMGGIVAVVAALLISSIVAWKIIRPVQAMMEASKRIADGDYADRLVVTTRDELGELALSFNRMAEALDDTEKHRMELIGNLAHELRTPLASIRSLMEGLIDGVLPAEAETFADVQHEAFRLERLTGELGELSRAEAGAIELNIEATDPITLCYSAASHLAPQFEDKGVALEKAFPETIPPTPMDRDRILQVLINLLGNALQYTEPGGIVRLGCEKSGAELRFTVSDTGIGIGSTELPKVFDRFYRVDKSRSRAGGGSGIGLTISQHLVRRHGGSISACSDGIGKGSSFSFSLPSHGPPARSSVGVDPQTTRHRANGK